MNLITTLAPCGMTASVCHSFQKTKKKNCPGCRGRTTLASLTRCERNRVLLRCPKFPLAGVLTALDERYRTNYNMSNARQPSPYIQGIREECFYKTTTPEKIPLSPLWQLLTVHLQLMYFIANNRNNGS